jgi:hypothetical protein
MTEEGFGLLGQRVRLDKLQVCADLFLPDVFYLFCT